MITIETAVYTFDELPTEAAKDRAREWYREGAFDFDWYEGVYEYATEIARLMGIEIDTRYQRTMGGKQVGSPAIFFSGFSSQGDGACFEGSYSYAKGSVAAIREYAPTDTVLHSIVEDLYKVQRRHFYQLTASVKHRGHYSHEYCTEIGVDDDVAEIAELLRRFMRWIYRTLESEWEYQNSDEQVDGMIRANEYTFTESGKRFG